MKYGHRECGTVDIISVVGRIDLSGVEDARETFRARLDQGQKRFLVDLSEIPRVDATGLSFLVNLLETARAVSGDVALLKPSDAVIDLLELVKLHQLFDIYADEQLALNRMEA